MERSKVDASELRSYGNILRPQVTNENGLRIFEEEIPREGIRSRVTINSRGGMMFDHSDSAARKSAAGRFERLKFDVLQS